MIVRAAQDPAHFGKIVTIVDWDFWLGGWVVEPTLYTNGIAWGAVDDKGLRPIRDPGPDAVDEMLQRIGKPEGVPA